MLPTNLWLANEQSLTQREGFFIKEDSLIKFGKRLTLSALMLMLPLFAALLKLIPTQPLILLGPPSWSFDPQILCILMPMSVCWCMKMINCFRLGLHYFWQLHSNIKKPAYHPIIWCPYTIRHKSSVIRSCASFTRAPVIS